MIYDTGNAQRAHRVLTDRASFCAMAVSAAMLRCERLVVWLGAETRWHGVLASVMSIGRK